MHGYPQLHCHCGSSCKFLNEENEIIEADGDIVDEDDDSVLDFFRTMTQREQREAREEWKARKDQIALYMWVDYCNKYRDGNTTETGM